MGIKDLHEKGIVGLDLRPQLITIDSVGITDRLQIDDIGLRSLLYALGYSNNQQMNAISALDPHYATPEHINRGQIGPWSDIYQSGLLLFDLVTGRLPFVGRTPAETGIMQSTSPIPHMTQYTHKTPHVLQEIVDCSLAKEPSKRFANAGALLNALEAIQLSPLPDHPVTAQITQPAQASTSLTKEIEPIKEDDVTLRETIIESYQPALPAVRQTLLAEDALAYLCYEQNERIAIKLKSTIVGRIDPKRGYTPDIDLSKFDPKMTISRQHARISFAETFFYIEDLKSRNKTRLGALPLTPFKGELLQHGDIIHFGSVRMSFELPGMAKVPVFKER
jgi:serine/threonine protein kinase